MPKAFDFGGVNLTAGEDSSGAKSGSGNSLLHRHSR